MQGFVVLLCLWLGLAVGQSTITMTPTLTPATLAPERPTQTPATLAPEEPTKETPATLAPDQPTLSPPICNEPGYNLDPLAR